METLGSSTTSPVEARAQRSRGHVYCPFLCTSCSHQLLLSSPGPAPEAITNQIFEVSKGLQEYHICPELQVDLAKIGKQTFEVDTFKPLTGDPGSSQLTGWLNVPDRKRASAF